MITRPYMNDMCDICIHKTTDDHCRLLRCHCGSVVECENHKEPTPREQYLNYNIKLTEQLFGVKFTGNTLQEKEDFYARYSEQRDAEVQSILDETYDEFTSG